MRTGKLKLEIQQQTAELAACRQTLQETKQNITDIISNPVVLCGGLIASFLVGYFFISKEIATSQNNAVNNPSSLFLLALTLLKSL